MHSTVAQSLFSSVDKFLIAILRRYVRHMHTNVMTILAIVRKRTQLRRQLKPVDMLLRQGATPVSNNALSLSV
jgi:hypothetical protein